MGPCVPNGGAEHKRVRAYRRVRLGPPEDIWLEKDCFPSNIGKPCIVAGLLHSGLDSRNFIFRTTGDGYLNLHTAIIALSRN